MNLNVAKLEEKLEKLPSQIYEAEKKVISAKESLDIAKAEYEVEYSHAFLDANGTSPEKKAKALIQTRVCKDNVIKAQKEYDRVSSYLKAQENHFVSLRKISSIEMELMKINAS